MSADREQPLPNGPPDKSPHNDQWGSRSPRLVALHAWSGTRPWLGGTVTTLGGLAIAVLPNQGFTVVVLPGVAGLSGFVLGALIIACGLYMLFSPPLHGILGIAAVLLSLVSFVTTNIGGYVIGMALGIVGGSLSVAWNPPDAD